MITTAVHLFTHHVIIKPSSEINQLHYDGYFFWEHEEQSQYMYTATVQFAVMVVKSPWGTFSKSAYFRIMCPSCGDPDCQAASRPHTQTLATSATFKIQK